MRVQALSRAQSTGPAVGSALSTPGWPLAPGGRRGERPSSARRSGGQPGLRGLGPAVLQRARRLGGSGSATLQPGSGIVRDKRCFLSELRGEAASTHLLNVLRGMGAV